MPFSKCGFFFLRMCGPHVSLFCFISCQTSTSPGECSAGAVTQLAHGKPVFFAGIAWYFASTAGDLEVCLQGYWVFSLGGEKWLWLQVGAAQVGPASGAVLHAGALDVAGHRL